MFKTHGEPGTQEHVTWGERTGAQVGGVSGEGSPGGLRLYRPGSWPLALILDEIRRFGKVLSRRDNIIMT